MCDIGEKERKMSKKKRYAYMVILLVTVCVMTPFMVREVWISHAETAIPAESVSEKEISGSASAAEKKTHVELQEQAAEESVQGLGEQAVEETAQPKETQQPSQEQAGKQFITSDSSYFDDALFIGDSRTVGISEYGMLENADYYADTGMAVDTLYKKAASIPGGVDFETMLTRKQYGKIYIMLGINEVGNNREKTLAKYQELLSYIKERQPGAIIYMQANLHVTQSRSDRDRVVNNTAINEFNSCLAQMADGETVFYIDANEIFDDASGNLNAAYSSDDTHILAKYYQNWTQWLCGKTIVR